MQVAFRFRRWPATSHRTTGAPAVACGWPASWPIPSRPILSIRAPQCGCTFRVTSPTYRPAWTEPSVKLSRRLMRRLLSNPLIVAILFGFFISAWLSPKTPSLSPIWSYTAATRKGSIWARCSVAVTTNRRARGKGDATCSTARGPVKWAASVRARLLFVRWL